VNDEIDRKILKSLEKLEPDEDEAFFISVLPSVSQLSADDKLDFRMIVLKAIKDIKTRSGYVSSPFSTQTHSPNSSYDSDRLSHPLTVGWPQTPETFWLYLRQPPVPLQCKHSLIQMVKLITTVSSSNSIMSTNKINLFIHLQFDVYYIFMYKITGKIKYFDFLR
jgi:hypothetical protein